MSGRLAQGFDAMPVGAATNLLCKHGWYEAGGVPDVQIVAGGAFGYGNCVFQFGGDGNGSHMVYPVGEQSEGFYGGRILVGAAHNGHGFFSFVDAVNGVTHVTVSWTNFGLIKVWRGLPIAGTLLISSPIAAFVDEAWFWLEVYCKIGNAAGDVQVRINTVEIINLNGLADTQNGARNKFDAVGFGHPGSASFYAYKIDDLYFNDPNGAVNNTFLGNSRVKALLPNGAGDSTVLARGGSAAAATNWQSVLNTALDGTKFVYSDTDGEFDLYTVTPIVNAPKVHFMVLEGALSQDDATQRIGRNLLKSGGVTIEGADVYLNQSVSVAHDVVELDPATGLQFTGPGANAIQIGPKVED